MWLIDKVEATPAPPSWQCLLQQVRVWRIHPATRRALLGEHLWIDGMGAVEAVLVCRNTWNLYRKEALGAACMCM